MTNLGILCLQMMRRHRLRCLLVAAFIFLTSIGFLYFLPHPMWQASGLIRIGQAPHSDGNALVDRSLLMPMESTMALIRQDADRVVSSNIGTNEQWLFRIKPTAEGLLELKVEAQSAEKASKIHAALVAELKRVHDELFDIRKEFWMKQNTLVSSDLEIGRKIWESQAAICASFSSNISEGSVLCANLLLHENARQDRQARLLSRIQEALLPVWSYPTDSFGQLSVSKEPISPNALISVALGLLATLFLSTILLIFSCVWNVMRDPDSKN